jgi:uncharacterized OB-fold protein
VSPRRAVHDGIFELGDDGTITLVGGYSPSSGRSHFPRFDVCPYTGADDVERVLLSRSGTLWAWTAVTATPPGYAGAVPFGFGIVELTAEQLRVVTRLTVAEPAALSFGQVMTVVADVVGSDDDGNELVAWAFAPEPRR